MPLYYSFVRRARLLHGVAMEPDDRVTYCMYCAPAFRARINATGMDADPPRTKCDFCFRYGTTLILKHPRVRDWGGAFHSLADRSRTEEVIDYLSLHGVDYQTVREYNYEDGEEYFYITQVFFAGKALLHNAGPVRALLPGWLVAILDWRFPHT